MAYSPNQSTDDCSYNVTTAVISLVETWVAFGADNPENADAPIQCGIRFSSMMIPQGSTINLAHLKLVASDAVSAVTVNATIKGEDANNADAFSTGINFSSRVRTASTVAWSNVGAWVAATIYQSPDIKTIIQEIVDRGGWQAGNAIVIFIEDNSSSANAYREFAAYDHLTYAAAQLCIHFT